MILQVFAVEVKKEEGMRGVGGKHGVIREGKKDTEECACSDGSVPINFEFGDMRTGCEKVSLLLKKKTFHDAIFARRQNVTFLGEQNGK